jgi:acyl-coenzyme A thioesterase PaaI-like protein
LVRMVAESPFATDEQLAERFGVSVATIRLDRQALNIPEVRERIRQVARTRQDEVRALEQQEVIGEILELHLNRYAVSVLSVQSAHVFSRNEILRGHFLFAQVNSLAIALMDANIAVTARTDLKFHRPVYLGEELRARVDVIAEHSGVVKCHAETESGHETVLEGTIFVAVEPTGLVLPNSERRDGIEAGD